MVAIILRVPTNVLSINYTFIDFFWLKTQWQRPELLGFSLSCIHTEYFKQGRCENSVVFQLNRWSFILCKSIFWSRDYKHNLDSDKILLTFFTGSFFVHNRRSSQVCFPRAPYTTNLWNKLLKVNSQTFSSLWQRQIAYPTWRKASECREDSGLQSWFGTSFFDWPCKLPPPYQPIRSVPATNHDSATHDFSRFPPFFFGFSLAHCDFPMLLIGHFDYFGLVLWH